MSQNNSYSAAGKTGGPMTGKAVARIQSRGDTQAQSRTAQTGFVQRAQRAEARHSSSKSKGR